MGPSLRLAGSCCFALFLVTAGCDGSADEPMVVDAAADEGAGGEAGQGGMAGEGGTGGTPPADMGSDAGCACPGQQTCDDALNCVEPEVCAGPEDCLPGRVCADGTCADACVGDGDCGDGQRCDGETGACVPDDRCGSDDDCPGGACVDGECHAPCDEAACPGRQMCDPDTGDCIEPDDCVDDMDCIDDRICVEGACATPCGDDTDCPGAQSCRDGQCAEPDVCTTDLDCTADRLCVADACADPCGRAGCPGGLVCDPGSGRCDEADPCADDDGCFPGRRCDDGVCTAPCVENADCPGVTRCVEGVCVEPTDCAFDDACGEGRICVDGTCVEGCPAAPCPPDAMCDEVTGRCVVEGGCLEAADCSGAQRCEGGRCIEPPVCNGDADCLGERACVEGTCVTRCAGDLDCPGFQVCADGQCAEGPGGCEIDDDCLVGRRCHPELFACVDACPFGNCPGGQICGDDGLCGEPGGCLDDSECVGDRVCRLGRCFAGGCESTADCDDVCVDFACADAVPDTCNCPAGWACIDGSCAQDRRCGPCPDGWLCGDDGLCTRCLSDDDCPGGGVCDGGGCRDPAACEADDDCLPGHICPFGRCEIDFLACEDDGVGGPGPDAATPLPALALTDLVVCEGRRDWYRLGDPDAAVRVTVRFALDAAPPAVWLYSVDDLIIPVAVAAPQPGEARVAAGPGDYVVSVSAAPGTSLTYGIDVEDGLGCVDDVFERPLPNDGPREATPIRPGEVRGTLCGNDVDVFRVEVPRRLQITIDGATAEADGRRAPVAVDGPTTIEVTGLPGSRYTLSIDPIVDPDAACAGAEDLLFDTPTDATVEVGGDDFAPACRGPGGPERVFRLATDRPGRLTARLEAFDPRGMLMLYGDCGAEPIACADAAGGIDTLVDAGEYFLVVDGPYAGDVRADLVADSPLCDAPDVLDEGATDIRMPLGPADIAGACTDPELGAVVRQFTVDERSIARLSLAGGGDEALVSIRAQCGDDQALGCGLAPQAEISPRLEPGTYYAIMQGAGDVTATLSLEPAADLPGFVDTCDGAPLAVGGGSDLPLEGDLTVGGDAVDLAQCGGLPASPDNIVRFRLAEAGTVLAFIEEAAFGARLAIVDEDCGQVAECGSPMTGDVFAELQPGTYGLVMEADGLGGGPFRVRLQVQ